MCDWCVDLPGADAVDGRVAARAARPEPPELTDSCCAAVRAKEGRR